MTNIFVGLTKYSETPQTTQKENQFTEALAYILSRDKILLNRFLKYCFNIQISKPIIKTQASYNLENRKQRPDMEIRGDDTLIFIENKVNSGLNTRQIEKYLAILKNNDVKKYKLMILTKNVEDNISRTIRNNHIIQKRWMDLYGLFQKYLSHNKSKVQFLLEDFLEFMERENMKPFETLKKDELDSWKKFNNLVSKFESLFEGLRDELKKRKYEVKPNINKNPGDINIHFRPKKCSKKYGDKKASKEYLKCEIALEPEHDTDELVIWCSIAFHSSAQYYEKYIANSKANKRIFSYLKRRGFDVETQRKFSKDTDIEDIIKNKKDGERQKRAIIKYFLKGLDEIEQSNFIKLLIRKQRKKK